jgi:glycosyltransferase involved in cell wall biosynthesis
MGESCRVAVISNSASSLIRFRGPLIRSFVSKGFTVYAVAPSIDQGSASALRALGAIPVNVNVAQCSLSLMSIVGDLLRLAKFFRNYKPKLVLLCFLRMTILGSVASMILPSAKRILFIEGLGSNFTRSPDTYKIRSTPKAVIMMWALLLSVLISAKTLVLNRFDKEAIGGKYLRVAKRICQIDGIGVNLKHYRPADRGTGNGLVYLYVGRLLSQKGLCEFAAAARLVRLTRSDAQFIIVGSPDGNPDSLAEELLQSWESEGMLKWVRHVEDVRPFLALASVFVYPSYYGEGSPRAIQEAMASGIPIITTSSPGCVDMIEHGIEGLRVMPRDEKQLSLAMLWFADNPIARLNMGANARALAERRFDEAETSRIILDHIVPLAAGQLRDRSAAVAQAAPAS